MKLRHFASAGVLAFGLGAGALLGTGVAAAAPAAPGIDFPQKPGHGPGGWDGWGPKPGKGHGHGPWGKGGFGLNGIDACISATAPYGNVSGFVCI